MAAPISVTQLQNASVDASTLEQAVNGSTTQIVTSRLGAVYPTVAKVINDASNGMNAAIAATQAVSTAAITNVQNTSNASIANVQLVSNEAIAAIEAVAAAQGYQVPVVYGAGIAMTTASQTVGYNGQTYAPILTTLPFTTSGTFETAKFRLIQGVAAADLATGTGAALVGFKLQTMAASVLRTLQDRASDALYARDCGMKFDGVTDDSFAWAAAWTEITTKGRKLILPEGTSNCGTWRGSYTGTTAGFSIVGAGAGLTVLKFADIPPTASNPTEPSLFTLTGTSAAPINDVRFADFTVDYSAQTNQGGASLANLALTDVVPYSPGVRVFYAYYCVGLKIERVNMNNVYGDGAKIYGSPLTRVDDCRLTNVSGGNPGAADSFGGGIGIMNGSWGSTVSNCFAFNTRTYKTGTIAGTVHTSALGLPCGYIGFWTEAQMNVNNTLPPYASNWLIGNVAADTAAQNNDENFGAVFRNCTAYGYTMGFKSQTGCVSLFEACKGLNCWMPFLIGDSRGSAVNCYADAMNLDGKTCPQTGYAYVQGLFVHYSVNNLENRNAGVTWDGCIAKTSFYPVYVDNYGYGKILNQQTWVNARGAFPVLYVSKDGGGGLYGMEIRGGHVSINGGNANYTMNFTDLRGSIIELDIVNNSSYFYGLAFANYYSDTSGSRIRINAQGLVPVSIIAGSGIDADIYIRAPLASQMMPANASLISSSCSNSRIKATLDVNTNIVSPASLATAGWLVQVSGSNNRIDAAINLVDVGSSTLLGLIAIGSATNRIDRIVKTGDVYNTPLVVLGLRCGMTHVEQASSNDAGAVFVAYSGPTTVAGPITLGPQVSAQNLFKVMPTVEPNSVNNLQTGLWYSKGVCYPYLLPTLSGPQGMTCFAAGPSGPAWVASHTYAAGAYVRNGGNIYLCTTGGASASSGGPSGTGTGIVDNAAVWNYVAAFAQFVTYGTYAASALI